MKSVLITGGTGFFGQAFVRHLLALDKGPERICVYSRGEFAQAKMRESLADDPRIRFFVGDVRDGARLRRAFNGVDVVIHAAALKRVEVGEYNPTEMVRTNVEGSMNVIEAATDARVTHVVALSTDKACEPLNAYGATKLVAEKMFLAANNTVGPVGPNFAVARYGNIAGSTGSVIPVWRARRHLGLSVTLSDPAASRFWMTVQQAVQVVKYCIGRADLTVPDLKAYRLGDLAEAMFITTDMFVRTGLGKGEKLFETMISAHEAPLFGWSREVTSKLADMMTVEDLREALRYV